MSLFRTKKTFIQLFKILFLFFHNTIGYFMAILLLLLFPVMQGIQCTVKERKEERKKKEKEVQGSQMQINLCRFPFAIFRSNIQFELECNIYFILS